jgi:hypothetical protein
LFIGGVATGRDVFHAESKWLKGGLMGSYLPWFMATYWKITAIYGYLVHFTEIFLQLLTKISTDYTQKTA